MDKKFFIHPTAVVEDNVTIGEDAKIWHFCHVRSGAEIGAGVSLAKDVFIDSGVTVADGSRIQNGVSVYKGVNIKPWCFIGPHVIFTNDQYPRVGNKYWNVVATNLETGCSIGAGAIIRCGITIGAFSMVGAGAVVTKSIKPFRLAVGIPAHTVFKVCACGQTRYELDHEWKDPYCQFCSSNMDSKMYDLAGVCFKEFYISKLNSGKKAA